MALVRSLSPRNPRAAVLWAACALVAAMLTSLVAQGATTPGGVSPGSAATAAVVVAVAAGLLRLPVQRVAPWVVVAPLVGIAAIVHLDLGSRDAGVTGLVFFVVPAVFAAAHLRWAGVVLVCAATTAGAAVVCSSVGSSGSALVDWTYVTVLVVLVSAVLGRAAAQSEHALGRLRLLADLDPLTGLATRRVLDAAAAELAGGHRPGGGALVLVDLDRFKAVNDTYGHLGGDAALAHVAGILRAGCRGDDVAARMGGDELAVLLLGCGAADAARRARDVVDRVRATPLVLPDGRSVALSVSVGVAPAGAVGCTASELYALADAALYEAKRGGRDRAVTASA